MNKQETAVLIDHDDFLTVAEDNIELYQLQFIPRFAAAFGLPQDDARLLITESRQIVLDNRREFPFMINGIRISTGTADHVLLTRSCAIAALEIWNGQFPGTLSVYKHQWGSTLTEIYKESYRYTKPVYEKHADEILTDLSKRLGGNFMIASGADADIIRLHLMEAFDWRDFDPETIGIAKNTGKSHVDPCWNSPPLPEYVEFPEYPFPVPMRKPTYYEFLKTASDDFRLNVILGTDNPTMDASLPEVLGMFTILKPHLFTSPWETGYYQTHGNGTTVHTLLDFRETVEHRL